MRTKKQALAAIHHQSAHGPKFAPGMCKAETGRAYDIPTDGTPDATSAWQHSRYRIPGVWVPGAFAWWTGGSHGHGHVAVCAFTYGELWSVDVLRPGYWDKVPFHRIHLWAPRLVWAGFSLDINGRVPVRVPSTLRRFEP